MMLRGYIIGDGRCVPASTLEELYAKLKRERITIPKPEQLRAGNTLERSRKVVIRGVRRLTQSERMRQHMKRPYRPVPDTKDIWVRIVKNKERA